MNDDKALPGDGLVAEPTRFEMVPHWVMDHPDITGSALRLYLLLRRYAGKNKVAYPSRRRLADDLNVSLPTVDSAKAVLAKIGAIQITYRVNDRGEQTSNLYVIAWHSGKKVDSAYQESWEGVGKKVGTGQERKLDRNLDPINLDPINLDDEQAEKTHAKALTVLEGGRQAEQGEKALYGPLLAQFDTFWKVYPRKAAKAPARKAWEKAITKVRTQVIIEAAERYRDDPNRDDAFTAHAATWLNQERWADDPLPSKPQGATAGDKRMQSYEAIYQQVQGKPLWEVLANEVDNSYE